MKLAIILAACVALAHSAAVDTAKLKFKVQGRKLIDKDNIGKELAIKLYTSF